MTDGAQREPPLGFENKKALELLITLYSISLRIKIKKPYGF